MVQKMQVEGLHWSMVLTKNMIYFPYFLDTTFNKRFLYRKLTP